MSPMTTGSTQVCVLLLCILACVQGSASDSSTASFDSPVSTASGAISVMPATGVPLREVPLPSFRSLVANGAHRSDAAAHHMHALAVATSSLAWGDVMSYTLASSTFLSLGYWLQVTSGANINVLLINETSYAAVIAGDSFRYWTDSSRVNVNLAYLPTDNIVIKQQERLVIFGQGGAPTSFKGIVNMQAAACVSSPSCSNSGLCTGLSACDCPPNGWGGATCSTPICAAVTCNSHQSCTAPDVCSCLSGWGGVGCATPVCDLVTCNSHQSCTGPNTCSCIAGWSGANCATPVCDVVTCNSHQACTAPNVCSCLTGWTGASCATPICAQGCVAGQGSCTAPDVCTCQPGFSGSSCQGVNGGYTAWVTAGVCTPSVLFPSTCTQTQSRSCTNPVPSNGGLDCSVIGASTRQVNCVCPPIHGGYSAWGSYGVCSGRPVCTASRSRSCTNPAPAHGGANCDLLGPNVNATVCTACDVYGAPLLGNAVITSDSTQMARLAESQGWMTQAQWAARNPAAPSDSDPAMRLIDWIFLLVSLALLFLLAFSWFLHQRRMRQGHIRPVKFCGSDVASTACVPQIMYASQTATFSQPPAVVLRPASPMQIQMHPMQSPSMAMAGHSGRFSDVRPPPAHVGWESNEGQGQGQGASWQSAPIIVHEVE